jgi:CRP-like cAMP-binding protein
MPGLRQILQAIQPLGDAEWEATEAMLLDLPVPKGSFLLREGEVCRQIYFIRKGLVRLYYLKDGETYIRQFFFEHAFATDLASCTTGAPSRLYIEALEDCELTVLPYAELCRLYDTFPGLQKLGRLLAEHAFAAISGRMASLFLQTPEERYLELIRSRPKVSQRIPQYMIASYLGVTPEGLSRIRRRIAAQDRDLNPDQ